MWMWVSRIQGPSPDHSYGRYLLQEAAQHLVHDKEELLGQVVSLQQQLEATRGECSRLCAKVRLTFDVCVCVIHARVSAMYVGK